MDLARDVKDAPGGSPYPPVRMIPRRSKRSTGPVLATLAIGVVPLILTLWITHHREFSHAQNQLNLTVERRAQAMDRVRSAADGVLHQLAEETKSLDPAAAAVELQRQVYRSPLFREAGLIRDGRLIASSLGATTPPLEIAPSQRSRSDRTGVQIVGVVRTQLMSENSLVLSLSTGPDSEVNLLVDPTLLEAAVLGPADLREGASVMVSPDGVVLLDSDTGSGTRGQSREKTIESVRVSERFGVRHVARLARSWAMRGWLEDAFILAPGGLLCCGLLAALVGEYARRTHGLDDELRLALANGEFEPHYQPTMELATGRCVGAEVLLRWKHPQSGYIRPDLFIAAAESSGLIVPITDHLMKSVVRDMSRLMRGNPSLHLGINLAPEQFASAALLPTLRSIFHPESIAPAQILLEATERTAMDGEAMMKAFTSLREAGFTIALDDFGTGYSSLSYLSRLRFDTLKIDASFVKRIGQDHVSSGLLDTIADLGRKLDVAMVAEGIETKPQLDYLIERGVAYGQGWLFAKAMPAADFIRFVHEHSAPARPGTMSGQAAI